MPKLSYARRHRKAVLNLVELAAETGAPHFEAHGASISFRTAPRKVSEEEIHFSTSGDETSSLGEQSPTPVSKPVCTLKRPLPSLSLMDLASSMSPNIIAQSPVGQEDLPPTPSSSPWGHFIDYDNSFDDLTHPPTVKRRRIKSPKPSALEGFILFSPSTCIKSLDEATAQLNALQMR